MKPERSPLKRIDRHLVVYPGFGRRYPLSELGEVIANSDLEAALTDLFN